MPICQVQFKSAVLDLSTTISVFLPNKMSRQSPVLYLLHGWSDDHNAWFAGTNLARALNDYPFVVVMPEVGHSYYTDMKYGAAYFTYLTRELPAFIENWFGLQPDNQQFVAGLSMGGYGAFKWALTETAHFTGAASLSGAVDIGKLWYREPHRDARFYPIFGSLNDFSGSENDLLALLAGYPLNSQTHFLQICGTEDFLYQDNRKFKVLAEKQFQHYQYIEAPGTHDWVFWEKWIGEVLRQFVVLLD